MRELALHLLDIAENSVAAQSKNILISVEEDLCSDKLDLAIRDDGKGMDEEMVARIVDPFVTSRTTRKVGLGIPLLKAAAEACNGYLKVQSEVGVGTNVEVSFQHSHIDRMPLGDLTGTFLSLVIGSPEIHWQFIYKVNGRAFHFDDSPIKKELEGIPLSDPVVLGFIREYLQEGIHSVQEQ